MSGYSGSDFYRHSVTSIVYPSSSTTRSHLSQR